MPKYYCDYCDVKLSHDSPNGRKIHRAGRKHIKNVRLYYQKWLEEQVQLVVNATTAAINAGIINNNPFAIPAQLPAMEPSAPATPGVMTPTMGPGTSMAPVIMQPHGPIQETMGMKSVKSLRPMDVRSPMANPRPK